VKLALTKTKTHARFKPLLQWESALPFIENKRALLIHRPRSVNIHRLYKTTHMAAHLFCGNTFTGNDKLTFLEAPPVDSILCARCEQAALKVGFPSASSIAGRHVHVGGLFARAHCCDYEIGPQE